MKALKPLSKRHQKNLKNKFYVFDVETTCLSPKPENFVFGVIYGFDEYKIIYSVEDFIKEFEDPKYKDKTIFAHNAEFDLLTLFGNIYQNIDNSAVFNGKFILCNYKNIRFCDSLNIFPTSVSKLGDILGLPKLDNDKVKENTLTKDNITTDDINYCIRDCEIIYKSLLKVFEDIGSIKITIASIGMYVFRKRFLYDDIVYNELVDEFFGSYYGGRTEAFKLGEVNAKVYDINSLYPDCMINTAFPDPRNLKKEININPKYLIQLLDRYEGMCKVNVTHKDSYFGYLPYRDEELKKLLFPVGTFTTTINFNELKFALSKGIITINFVEYTVYSSPIKSPFIDYVNFHYNERLNTDNEFLKFFFKLLLNSLYGRFAMRMKYKTTYFDNVPIELIEEIQQVNGFYDLRVFSKDREDCFLTVENESLKNSYFSIALFSSYITSAGRIKLLNGLLQNEKNGVAYCDTDSIFLEKNFIGDVGKKIGQFKLEDKIVTEINGLKNYVYIHNDETITLIKGVGKGSIKIGENKYQIKQYYKTKESLRQKKEAGDIKTVVKELKHKYDKRTVLTNGETKPIYLN